MPTHFSGKKISPSHTTAIDAAQDVINRAKQLPEVSKITLGIIKNIGNGKRKVIFKKIPAGLLVKIRGNTAIQELFIFTSKPTKTQEEISKLF